MANSKESNITENRKARHDYEIIKVFEAGLVLEGWEIKSLRAHRVQLRDSYAVCKNNEIWLLNSHISPLASASTHIHPEPYRTRKLLLKRREINELIGAVQLKGLSIIPLKLYWNRAYAKLSLALCRGKKAHDKRQATADRDWKRQQERLRKHEH
jgi:SsrA-binding protein